ncbi:MAG: DUF1080 domain-containing protein [Fimbriimonadaceae bacterium]|nr:DUF1080 domain-containing protein [Fimbriimonadaceae bacterium]
MLTTAVLATSLLLQQAQAVQWVERPFGGKTLDGWLPAAPDKEHKWTVGHAVIDPHDDARLVVSGRGNELVNLATDHGTSQDIHSTAQYPDIHLTLDVMVPHGSNSGIYLMGEYEVQVLDSYGHDRNPDATAMGAVYGVRAPFDPRYRKAGDWNSFDIKFRAPRFDAQGKKVENARLLSVRLNGREIHRDLELTGPTPGGVTGVEHPVGPIMFQGNHGPVAFRNIRVRPLR